MEHSWTYRALLLALTAALLCSCNSQVVEEAKPVVQGKLTKGGQPIAVDPSMGDYAYVQAIFMPPGGLPPYNVRVAPDGSFTIARDDGQPLPAGQYRVAVRQWEPYPMNDKLGGKFDERNTPIVVEITNPPKDLAIDLDKPKG